MTVFFVASWCRLVTNGILISIILQACEDYFHRHNLISKMNANPTSDKKDLITAVAKKDIVPEGDPRIALVGQSCVCTNKTLQIIKNSAFTTIVLDLKNLSLRMGRMFLPGSNQPYSTKDGCVTAALSIVKKNHQTCIPNPDIFFLLYLYSW